MGVQEDAEHMECYPLCRQTLTGYHWEEGRERRRGRGRGKERARGGGGGGGREQDMCKSAELNRPSRITKPPDLATCSQHGECS